MICPLVQRSVFAAPWILALLAANTRAADTDRARIEAVVARAVHPVMTQYAIPGTAVGIVDGDRTYVFNTGVLSKSTGQPVTDATLFGIGSVTKTFTATLASYAEVTGHLSLSEPASRHLPVLRGSRLDSVTLVNLGTHTAGGFPLQVPDGIANTDQLIAYFRAWQPAHPPGTFRTYANPSVGLLGMVSASSLNGDFAALMKEQVFSRLGLANTYLDVPSSEMAHYAQGTTASGAPIRMAPGILQSEAYAVRTTAADLVRFIEANMRMLPLDDALQRAITATHTGYYRVGAMTQDLIWEQYRFPFDVNEVLEGNSPKIAFESNPASALEPPQPPRDDVLVNKTGSTNGFAAYVAFVPSRKLGVVLLANRSLPNAPRVTAACEILSELDSGRPRD